MSSFDDLQEACECLEEAFRQLGNDIEKMVEAFQQIFAPIEEERKKKSKGTSPRVYGASLVSNSAAKSSVKSYGYIPSVRRNLPYQRRRF